MALTKQEVVSSVDVENKVGGQLVAINFPLILFVFYEEGRTYTHHDVRAAPFTYSTETPIFNYLIIHKFN